MQKSSTGASTVSRISVAKEGIAAKIVFQWFTHYGVLYYFINFMIWSLMSLFSIRAGFSGKYADFISKMGTVEEETDESIYWMELLIEARIADYAKLDSLMKEANELVAITVSSIKTARRKRNK